jgi:hypothetical protein
MQVRNPPKLVLALLGVVFFAVFSLALLSPAYVTTSSPQNSHVINVVQVSYLHPVKAASGASANFTNYISHNCLYHD